MYITEFNLRRALKKIDTGKYQKNVESFLDNLNFFTDSERKELFLFRIVTKYPEVLTQMAFQNVNRGKVYMNGRKPAYHAKRNCGRLNADFQGAVIPQELLDQGREEEVLDWFGVNEYLLNSGRYDAFKFKFRQRFRMEVEIDELDNSGVLTLTNESLRSIEQQIKELISSSTQFARNERERKILRAFCKIHYITKRKNFKAEHYDTEEVLTVVQGFNDAIRYPLMKLLRKYFMMKYNSQLNYNQNVLDQLGFVPCGCCKNINK